MKALRASDIERWREQGDHLQWNGQNIFYRVTGQGPPLLLVHGYPVSSIDWISIAPDLESRFTVVALDLPGFGFSDKPRRAVSIAEHADAVIAVLKHLNIQDCRILAHDLGDTVVQELLARVVLDGDDTHRYAQVVLLNGGLFAGIYRPRLIQKILSSPLGAVVMPLLGFSTFARNMRRMFAVQSQPDTASLRQMWQVIQVHQGDRLLHLSGRFNQERERYGQRYREALQKYPGKLCFINGLDDPNSGAHMADAFARFVPDGELIRLPGVGHWPQLEDPSTAVAHIMRALL